MLYTDEERAVMADAIQPNMRATNISRKPFSNIIEDFFDTDFFSGAAVLDVGPGQLDFLDIVKEHGAETTAGLDFDPAIQALAELRGHKVRLADLREEWPEPPKTYDLIFCRGSINCYWYASADRLRSFLDGMTSSLKAGGKLWIAPWNKPPAGKDDVVPLIEGEIYRWAEANGISIIVPEEPVRTRYGIGYGIPKVTIWQMV